MQALLKSEELELQREDDFHRFHQQRLLNQHPPKNSEVDAPSSRKRKLDESSSVEAVEDEEGDEDADEDADNAQDDEDEDMDEEEGGGGNDETAGDENELKNGIKRVVKDDLKEQYNGEWRK